jgi:hypothetical protein
MIALPPVLSDLQARLKAHQLTTDAREIAGVLLEIAREQGWANRPEKVNEWLGELALDVGQTPLPPRRLRP